MGLIMGCVTYGLCNPFAAAPKKKKSVGRPADSPRTREFGRDDSPIEPELNRDADNAGRNRNTRCRSSRLTPRSRDGLRAGPTDTPGFSPAYLSCGRSTWCPVTVPSMGRPADPRRPTSWARDNRRYALPSPSCHSCEYDHAPDDLGWIEAPSVNRSVRTGGRAPTASGRYHLARVCPRRRPPPRTGDKERGP
jgi:hypothetical protein